jgi:hypothetical protein
MQEINVMDSTQTTACSGISVLCGTDGGDQLEQGLRHILLDGRGGDDTFQLNRSATVFGGAGVDKFVLNGEGFFWIDDFAPQVNEKTNEEKSFQFETIDLRRYSSIRDLGDLFERRNLGQEEYFNDGGYDTLCFDLSPNTQLVLYKVTPDQLGDKNFIFAESTTPNGEEATDKQTDIDHSDTPAVQAEAAVFTGYELMVGLLTQASMIASVADQVPQTFEISFPPDLF